MLCSVQSNPSDYSIIRMNLDIPWKCDYVKYYISSINTKANFLSTTDDDYLLFEWEVAKDDQLLMMRMIIIEQLNCILLLM